MPTTYRVTLDSLGFHVEHQDGTRVFAMDRPGCRYINGTPTFASRHIAQSVADDLNADDS